MGRFDMAYRNMMLGARPRREIQYGGNALQLGFQQAPPPIGAGEALKEEAPPAQRADYGAMAEALSGTPTIESGNALEAIMAALEGGIRGRAARDERSAEELRSKNERADVLEATQAENRGAKAENEQVRAFIDTLPEDQRQAAWLNSEPFVSAQAPLSRGDQAQLDLQNRRLEQDASQFEQAQATTRRGQNMAHARGGQPSLNEARQWTNSYNDDTRTVMNDLGNMRAAIPYAAEVVRANGAPTGNFRMNDVALLRAAARAQTGPGVLTESETFATLSPSLQQSLVRAASYADISRAGLVSSDRLALARYVQQGAMSASGDLWRRYEDAENVLGSRNVELSSVGISPPEYLHPNDMESFSRFGAETFRRGRPYVAPSGRAYIYEGPARFRYVGRQEYNPAQRVDRPHTASPEVASTAGPPPPGVDAAVWNELSEEERRLWASPGGAQ